MIFNIQCYSMHDNPSIRTMVSLKGCSPGCQWCQNPESHVRMQDLLYDARLCFNGCDLYAQAAPAVTERALNGLLIHREKLADDALAVLAHCCLTQTLTVYGEVKSVDDIMMTVLRGKPFHDRSGGGLTLLGGEPLMQSEPAVAPLKADHDAGVRTAVEACLYVSWKYIEPSLPDIDLFLADLKRVADASFKQWTDGCALHVLENLKELAAASKKAVTRMPLVQGFGADEVAIQAITGFATDKLHAGETHFLPYHILDINKYHLLSQSYNVLDRPPDALALLGFAQQYASLKGLIATLRG